MDHLEAKIVLEQATRSTVEAIVKWEGVMQAAEELGVTVFIAFGSSEGPFCMCDVSFPNSVRHFDSMSGLAACLIGYAYARGKDADGSPLPSDGMEP